MFVDTDGDHGPDGGLHGPADHLGTGDEFAGAAGAGDTRLEREMGSAAAGAAGEDAVRLSKFEEEGTDLFAEADEFGGVVFEEGVGPGGICVAEAILG